MQVLPECVHRRTLRGLFWNIYKIPAYSLVGFHTAWSKDRLRVFGGIRNSGDEEYIARGVHGVARPHDAIMNPGEPLSVYIGVSMDS